MLGILRLRYIGLHAVPAWYQAEHRARPRPMETHLQITLTSSQRNGRGRHSFNLLMTGIDNKMCGRPKKSGTAKKAANDSSPFGDILVNFWIAPPLSPVTRLICGALPFSSDVSLHMYETRYWDAFFAPPSFAISPTHLSGGPHCRQSGDHGSEGVCLCWKISTLLYWRKPAWWVKL